MIDGLLEVFQDLITGKAKPNNPGEVLFIEVFNHARMGLQLGDFVDSIEEDPSALFSEEELIIIILGYSLGQKYQLNEDELKTDTNIH